MLPTVPYLQKRFSHFNNLCFEGKLKPVPILLNNRVSSAGLTHFDISCNSFGKKIYKNFSIEVSVRLDLPAEEFDYTLVHEMIHYYILSNNIQDDSPHGHVFRSIMNDLNSEYNLRIALKFNPEDELLLKPTNITRLIFVLELRDGTTGLAVVARTRIFQLWDFYSKASYVLSMRCYASNMAIFQHYRTFQTPKYYIIDADRIQHYLIDAVELERHGSVISRKL